MVFSRCSTKQACLALGSLIWGAVLWSIRSCVCIYCMLACVYMCVSLRMSVQACVWTCMCLWEQCNLVRWQMERAGEGGGDQAPLPVWGLHCTLFLPASKLLKYTKALQPQDVISQFLFIHWKPESLPWDVTEQCNVWLMNKLGNNHASWKENKMFN